MDLSCAEAKREDHMCLFRIQEQQQRNKKTKYNISQVMFRGGFTAPPLCDELANKFVVKSTLNCQQIQWIK